MGVFGALAGLYIFKEIVHPRDKKMKKHKCRDDEDLMGGKLPKWL